ncbi:MAG: DNA primase [Micavibrio sp.]|nr:MAG: DNA primase [Micavibrio sp.]
MTIPPRFLDEIRSRLSLSDVIGKRVRVTRAGREFKACCPFHKEKTPSFTINDDKQFYHCFGCGAHGDVIGFVMQHDNRSFIEAIEMLAAEAGLQVPEQTPQDIEKAKKQKNLYSLMEEATSWMEEQLYVPGNKEILAYLDGRGLKRETLASFRVGYAPADRQALRSYLKEQDYDDKDMIDAGLLKPSDRGGDPYVFFRDRIMFPVSDRRGRVVAFGGRALPDHMRPQEKDGYTPAKYINSPDTVLFDKGRMLYGESLARQAAMDGHSVIVTEGYMDVIACHQGGFKGAVAGMGTALTEQQILSLWKMVPDEEKTPTLCFDGDNAGRRAAERACERIMPMLAPNQSARFAFLPDGEDPDSLLRSGGKDAFKNILSGALPLLDFIWAKHTGGRRFETPEARAGVIKALQNEIKEIADRDVQVHYQRLIQDKISETFFARRSYKNSKYQGKPAIPAMKLRSPAMRGGDIYARILVACVLNHPHIYDGVEESFGGLEIRDESLARLRQAAIEVLEESPDLDRGALHTHLKEKGFKREMGDILSESVYVHAAFSGPRADPDEVGRKWLAFWGDIQGKASENEEQGNWKKAFYASNEAEEEKLRNMVRVRASEKGS